MGPRVRGSAAPVMGTRKGSVSATLLRNCHPGNGPSQGKSPLSGSTGSGVAEGGLSVKVNGIGAISTMSTDGAFRAGVGFGPCLHPVFLVVKKHLDSSRRPLMHCGPAVGEEGRLDNSPNGFRRRCAGNDDGKLPMLSAHHLANPAKAPISRRQSAFRSRARR